MAQLILPKKRLESTNLNHCSDGECIDDHFSVPFGTSKESRAKKRNLMINLEKNNHDKVRER